MLSISETAGLGMKATEADFKDQFKDKRLKNSLIQNQEKKAMIKLMH